MGVGILAKRVVLELGSSTNFVYSLKGAVYFLKSTRHLLNCSFILQNLFTDVDPFF